MLATLLLALAAAPVLRGPATLATDAPRVAPDGRVATPAGVRFRLPRGFSYGIRTVEGASAYLAEAPDHARAVIVAAGPSDAALECPGDDFRPHRTRRGLRGCLAVGGPADNAAVLAVKRGAMLVVVTALATAGPARALATSVGDSIEIDEGAAEPGPGSARGARADPRLVGCFDQGWATSAPFDSVHGDGGTKRCFEADLTFTEERTVNVVIPGVGGRSRSSSRSGTWRFSGGVLELSYEDGQQVTRTIEFLGEPVERVLADGVEWERL
ncbi:MAG TPA: hypothetical protein VF841_20050 [Anaeromyxobacter sp.]